MNKKLLAAAVAMSLASVSHAAVDLNADNPTTAIFASEIQIDATNGVPLSDAAGSLDVTNELGFGANAGDVRYLRYELSNGAEFTNNPTLTVTSVGGIPPAALVPATVTGSLVQGGAGQNFAVFSATVPADDSFAQDAAVALTVDGITAASTAAVTVTYTQHGNPSDAGNGENDLASTASATLLQFAPAIDFQLRDVTSGEIDVAEGGISFTAVTDGTDAGDTTAIGAFILDLNEDAPTAANGSPLTALPAVAASGVITVTGDFTAAADADNPATFTVSNVFLDDDVECGGVLTTPATTLTADTATFNITTEQGAYSPAETIRYVCMTVNGETTVMPGSYNMAIDLTAAAGYVVTDVANVALNTLEYNGSDAYADFALTPNGAYVNFVRVSNLTNMAGPVNFIVFNDDGDSASFGLSAVAGYDADELAGQASTGLININDMFAAAQSADAGFGLGATNKLRVQVFGAFTGDRGIGLQSFSVSQDGNSFSMNGQNSTSPRDEN